MKVRVYLTSVFFIICLAAEGLSFVGTSCEKPVIFEWDTEAIKLGEPFSFKVSLCDEKSRTPDRVTANAIMPAHQHGMNYTPTVTFDKKTNSYIIEDFLFHMPGQWEITVSSYLGDKVKHYTKTVVIN